MEEERKLNVLVLGASGVGKTTLIRAISGTRPVIGRGQSETRRVDIYESDTWPFRLMEARGFEYGYRKQRKKAKTQMRKLSKEQMRRRVQGTEWDGIDVVWCCVDGSSRRNHQRDIELMSRLIKRWRDVPVIAVITRSCYPQDHKENIASVRDCFCKAKNVNLRQVIPVLAKEAFIDSSLTAPPTGVDELCGATLELADEARIIRSGNRRRMALEQKRFTANATVGTAAAAAAVVGAVPFSFADSAVLVPLETLLTRSVLKIYDVKFSGELVSAIVGSAAITNLAKAIITPLKTLPIAGSVINGVVAGMIVLALGQAEIAVGEAIHTGKLDPSRMDDVIKTIEKKTADSPVLGAAVRYLQQNASSLTGKSAREIFAILQKVVGKKLLK